jgi:hypothetical protein
MSCASSTTAKSNTSLLAPGSDLWVEFGDLPEESGF